MSGYSGSLVLLKIENYDQAFVTIGGMRCNKFSLNNQMIDISNKSSGKWRLLLESAGISSANITGSGIFTNSDSEILLKNIAFNAQLKKYQLCFASGDIIEGNFFISHYERIGNFAEEENYAIGLESSGELIYTRHE